MGNGFRRIAQIFFLVVLPVMTAHAAESTKSNNATPPKPVLLPGEYAVSRFDLARGSGTNWRSCIGTTTIGPGIAPTDLEVTYVKENSFRIAIKGTGDAIVCRGFYAPTTRELAHMTIIRFYDANRWTFEDIDKRTNLRARATPASVGQSGPAPTPGPAPAPAPTPWSSTPSSSSSQILKCVGPDGRVTYTATPCPGTKEQKPQSTVSGGLPVPPTVQHGRWKIKFRSNGDASEFEECGNPLEKIASEFQTLPQVKQKGCTFRTASPSPRNVSVSVDCPVDWVSADGSQSIMKGQTNTTIDSPTPQSFSMSMRSTARGTQDTIQGTRIGDCR